jgi:adenylylsulfate kinase
MGTSKKGRVVWITGLSGSGKTTVAGLLKAALEDRGERVVLLDGDALRAIMPLGDRYDRASRLSLALSYGGLCNLIAEQGFTVICATISMRKEVFEWNRRHIANYVEVFLDVPVEIRAARDPKRYYARLGGGQLTEFTGYDVEVDYPANPDLHLRPTLQDSPAATAGAILRLISR